MKDAQVGASHEPEMERGNIGVADKCLGIALEDLGLQVGNHAHGAIASGATNDGLHMRIQPDAHEVLGAAFVLGAREATERGDFRIEENGVTGALECFDSARQPTNARRVRRRNDTYRVAFREGRWAKQRL